MTMQLAFGYRTSRRRPPGAGDNSRAVHVTEHDAIEARPPIPPGTVAWSEADALDRRLPAGAGDPAAGIAGPPPFLSVGARRWQYGTRSRVTRKP